jgi:Mn-dependent DtxR family transcriptional regulator
MTTTFQYVENVVTLMTGNKEFALSADYAEKMGLHKARVRLNLARLGYITDFPKNGKTVTIREVKEPSGL